MNNGVSFSFGHSKLFAVWVHALFQFLLFFEKANCRIDYQTGWCHDIQRMYLCTGPPPHLSTVSLRRTITPFTIGMRVCNFLSDKETSGKLFELRDFTFTSALPMGKDRTKFSSRMKKVLVLADIFQDSIRARDTKRKRRGPV